VADPGMHGEGAILASTKTVKIEPGFAKLTYEERLTRMKMPTFAYRRARGSVAKLRVIIVARNYIYA
jgi:hypothetical protein